MPNTPVGTYLSLFQNNILIHNLITYTTLRTNHLKSDKNTTTIAKSPPKLPNNQSNQIIIIHSNVRGKKPRMPQEQSYRKTEATKVSTIMEKLDKWDRNGYQSKTTTITLKYSMNKTTRKELSKGQKPILQL